MLAALSDGAAQTKGGVCELAAAGTGEDGDEDEKVQDGTPWERPASPKKPKRGVFEQVAGAVADAAEAAGERRANRKKNRKKKREDKKPAQGQQEKPDRVADALERIAGIVQPKETSERRERNRVTRQSVTNRVPRSPSGVESRSTTERRENQERLQQLWSIGNEIEDELTDIFKYELGLGDDSFDIDNPDHVKAVQDRIDDYLTNEVDWIRQSGARLQNFLDDLKYVRSLNFEDDRVDPLENAPDSLKQIYAKVRAGKAVGVALMAASVPIPDRKTPKQLTADKDRIIKVNRAMDNLLGDLEDSIGRVWDIYGDKELIGQVRFNPKNPDHIEALEESLTSLLDSEDANVRMAGAKFQRRVDVVNELQAFDLNQTSKDHREDLSEVAKNWVDQIMKDNKLTEGSIADPRPNQADPPPPPRPRGIFGTIKPKPKTPPTEVEEPRRGLFAGGPPKTPSFEPIDELGQGIKANSEAVKLELDTFAFTARSQLARRIGLGDDEPFDINNDDHIDAVRKFANKSIASDDEDERAKGILAFHQLAALRHIENNKEELARNTEDMPVMLQKLIRGRVLGDDDTFNYTDAEETVTAIYGYIPEDVTFNFDELKEEYSKLSTVEKNYLRRFFNSRSRIFQEFAKSPAGQKLSGEEPTAKDIANWLDDIVKIIDNDEYLDSEDRKLMDAIAEDIFYMSSYWGDLDGLQDVVMAKEPDFQRDYDTLINARSRVRIGLVERQQKENLARQKEIEAYDEASVLDKAGLIKLLADLDAELDRLAPDKRGSKWREYEAAERLKRQIENDLLPNLLQVEEQRAKRAGFDKGKIRERLEGFRPTAAGLLRRVGEKINNYKSVDKNRDENGFHVAKSVPVGNAGIDTPEKAIEFLRDGGDLADVPDEFLVDAIYGNPSRFTKVGNKQGGVNGIQIIRDQNGNLYGIKFADGRMAGQGEDANELLGHHYAERLGFAQGGMRIGGPLFPLEDAEYGYIEDIVPLVFDLAQNLHGEDIFHTNDVGDDPWVESAGAVNLVIPTLLDAITFNPDRHGGNFFVYTDPDTGENFFIPIDNGLSFDGWDAHSEVNDMSPMDQLRVWAVLYGDRNSMMRELANRLVSGNSEDREAIVAALKEAQELLKESEELFPLDEATDQITDAVDPARTKNRMFFSAERRAKLFAEMTPEEFIEWILEWKSGGAADLYREF